MSSTKNRPRISSWKRRAASASPRLDAGHTKTPTWGCKPFAPPAWKRLMSGNCWPGAAVDALLGKLQRPEKNQGPIKLQPLTPALSRRERENRWQPVGETGPLQARPTQLNADDEANRFPI